MSSLTTWRRLSRLLFIAAIPVATVCLLVSLTLFAGNRTEFYSSFPAVVGVILPFALISIVVIALPALAMSKDGPARYEAILCALAILFWVQGNVLVWNYGVLDGTRINWTLGAWRGVLDVSIWVVLLLVAICAHRRVGRRLFIAASAVLVIQLLSAVVTLIASPDVLQAKETSSNPDGRESVLRFSSDKNIVHIVMDGFQADIFASILADSRERDIKSELRGFTFFDRHLGAYPYTQLTLPAMLSGKLFDNGTPVESFVTETISGSTVINDAIRLGYEVDVAAPVSLNRVYTIGNFSNAYSISNNEHVTARDYARVDAAKLIDLAIFRVVPHFAKALVHRDELWVFQRLVQPDSYLHMGYFSDLEFLQDLADEMVADRETPVYKMIHVMLSHRPFVANEQCQFGGEKDGDAKTRDDASAMRFAARLERIAEHEGSWHLRQQHDNSNGRSWCVDASQKFLAIWRGGCNYGWYVYANARNQATERRACTAGVERTVVHH